MITCSASWCSIMTWCMVHGNWCIEPCLSCTRHVFGITWWGTWNVAHDVSNMLRCNILYIDVVRCNISYACVAHRVRWYWLVISPRLWVRYCFCWTCRHPRAGGTFHCRRLLLYMVSCSDLCCDHHWVATQQGRFMPWKCALFAWAKESFTPVRVFIG